MHDIDRQLARGRDVLVQRSYSTPSSAHDNRISDGTTRLVNRLSSFVHLDDEERQAVVALTLSRRRFVAMDTLIRESSVPDRACLILSGVAFRYRYQASGRRQIFGYLLPGDLCDPHFIITNTCDHNVGLLCDSEVAAISLLDLKTTMSKFPKIERALLMMALVDAAIMRECLLNIGQRDASQKLAHFFCELAARFHDRQDTIIGSGVTIPLTQGELADTMGLTVVHVNRVLQRFRRDRILSWSRCHFDILDYPRLTSIAGFDAGYLRLRETLAETRTASYG